MTEEIKFDASLSLVVNDDLSFKSARQISTASTAPLFTSPVSPMRPNVRLKLKINA